MIIQAINQALTYNVGQFALWLIANHQGDGTEHEVGKSYVVSPTWYGYSPHGHPAVKVSKIMADNQNSKAMKLMSVAYWLFFSNTIYSKFPFLIFK